MTVMLALLCLVLFVMPLVLRVACCECLIMVFMLVLVLLIVVLTIVLLLFGIDGVDVVVGGVTSCVVVDRDVVFYVDCGDSGDSGFGDDYCDAGVGVVAVAVGDDDDYCYIIIGSCVRAVVDC